MGNRPLQHAKFHSAVGRVVAHAGDRGQRIGISPMVAGLALTALLGAGMFLLIEAIAEPMAVPSSTMSRLRASSRLRNQSWSRVKGLTR